MMEIEAFIDKDLGDGLIERTSSMLDEIASRTVHKDKDSDRLRKK